MNMDYFTLDEIRFVPTSYRKKPIVIGSGIRRAFDGTAHRDVTSIKHEFEFELLLSQPLWIKFYKKFISNSQHLLVDDEGNNFVIAFGDEFTVNNREVGEEVYYSGTQRFVEV